ncbi:MULTISPECIES: SMC-Scp complex subunit ScpB [unclassified Colwellia]|uniref:SMC-Scp complex subunit ScpB n=1 Tax=unclassified Colwellia TaxID=196834 RepID=UPI0015F3C888|nr:MULTISPECIES: SMC-Scp complex subunit ScpB [unclassified Colwellia]MBA6234214.1 SMC-Scp complex subunit ScpB [Colwellia sp. MB02u-7]MBA6237817.1 SMC-Scp complex subunit ScpB [Colwellia sp. MB02u-11]MBA6254830.1 SMC-Scp complex subunit ScpB [Colwellia sp. MB3u-28]MBA6259852.1 SMC-Scp complex subunit ScpB [Colwellia sp. MB3u-41]MBA6300932.1 SMC-Scp complex subunit ScpB [Colwellia sp. MB3u-22]
MTTSEQAILSKLIEAAFFVSDGPLSVKQIKVELLVNYQVTHQQIRDVINQLVIKYKHSGINLVQVASGYRFETINELNEDLALFVAKLTKEKAPKYSRALLETLALIAYKQPITRGEIEDIRGVAVSSYIMKTLLERNWVKVVGNKEVPGRPSLYATTKVFLDYFSLTSLSQLPDLLPMADLGVIDRPTQEVV